MSPRGTNGLLTAMDNGTFEKIAGDALQVAHDKIEQGLNAKGGEAVAAIVATNLGVYTMWKVAPTAWMAR